MNNFYNTSPKKKKAFTLAEAIIALAVIAVVVSASIPIITVKLKNDFKESEAEKHWFANEQGQGLITQDPVAIGSNTNIVYPLATDSISVFGVNEKGEVNVGATAATYPVCLSYHLANPESLFYSIRADRPLFKVGDYNFSLVRNNVFITKSSVPNPFDGPACFFNDACNGNIFIGGKNCSTNVCDKAGEPDILSNAADGFSNNTIIGSGNNSFPVNMNGSLVAGFGNKVRHNNVTVIGRTNETNANNQFIIGNTVPNGADDILAIGIPGKKIISATGATVTFAGPTVVTGNVNVTGIIYTNSDKRLKNIKDEYNKGLNEILKIQPQIFSYKNDKTNALHVGVIAQDVEPFFPEAVTTMPDGFLAVDISSIFFATMNAIKELDEKTEYERQRTERLKQEYLSLMGKNKNGNSLKNKIMNLFRKIKRKFCKKSSLSQVELLTCHSEVLTCHPELVSGSMQHCPYTFRIGKMPKPVRHDRLYLSSSAGVIKIEETPALSPTEWRGNLERINNEA